MAVNYDKLWSLLIQKGMTRTQMRDLTGITTNTLAKMGKNESIQVEVLGKICVALNCKLDDVVDFDGSCEKYIPLPNIDLGELECCEEFERLGHEHLYDFPHPVTRKSVQQYLYECVVSCKLTKVACLELIERLGTEGVIIKLPKEMEPDIRFLPESFSYSGDMDELDDDDIDPNAVEVIQVTNYTKWAIDKSILKHSSVQSQEVSAQSCEKALVEYGISRADSVNVGLEFCVSKQAQVSSMEMFPINLLADVFWAGCYVYESRKEDILASVDAMLETLTPCEAYLINLIYRNGLRGNELMNFLELPDWESVRYCIEHKIVKRAIRKLRHPSRCKKWRDLVSGTSPQALVNSSGLSIYDNHVLRIIETVKESLQNEGQLLDAISPFYRNEIAKKVVATAAQWMAMPDVIVENMAFSYRIHCVLKDIHVTSLEDLWDIHGRDCSLDAIDTSGLKRIRGLNANDISEILSAMRTIKLGIIDSSSAGAIVDYAERIAGKSATSTQSYSYTMASYPGIVCAAMPDRVLHCLLNLKYRNIDDLIADSRTGLLSEA